MARQKIPNWPPILPRGFPLTLCPRGYTKKINGKLVWICGKKQPGEALAIYHRKAVSLGAGEKPIDAYPRRDGYPTVMEMFNRWLHVRQSDALSGELKPGSYIQYRRSLKRIDKIIGYYTTDTISPDVVQQVYDRLRNNFSIDFARRAISHFATVCRDAEDFGWSPKIMLGDRRIEKLVSKPRPVMRWRLYTPGEIQNILAATQARIAGRCPRVWEQLYAMILLALNGGYGSTELSALPREVVDLDGRRLDYRRGKTGSDHVVPLWDESVAALRVVMDDRPGDEFVFRNRAGRPWVQNNPVSKTGALIYVNATDGVNERFREVTEPLGLRIPGSGFYKLKHLHCTIADRAGDPHATFTLAGHKLPGAKSHYVHVGEDRVRKVVEFIREHLGFKPVAGSSPAPGVSVDEPGLQIEAGRCSAD